MRYYIGKIVAIPSDELQHHGIIGQKWGVRHGPPYPLSKEKSAAVKEKAEPKFAVNSGKVVDYLKKKHAEKVERRDNKQREDLKKALEQVEKVNPRTNKSEIQIADERAAKARQKYEETKMKKDFREVQFTQLENNYKVNREKSCIKDPKSGLYKKNKEFTEDEDTKSCNPGYVMYTQSTTNNCMLCSTAYDMRRRGFEVIAKRAASGYTYDALKRWYKNPEIKHDIPKDAIENIRKEGDGARGNIMLSWPWGGHSMIYEVKGGKVIIRDCQSGEIYDEKGAMGMINMAIYVSHARLDNLEVDYDKIKEVLV